MCVNHLQIISSGVKWSTFSYLADIKTQNVAGANYNRHLRHTPVIIYIFAEVCAGEAKQISLRSWAVTLRFKAVLSVAVQYAWYTEHTGVHRGAGKFCVSFHWCLSICCLQTIDSINVGCRQRHINRCFDTVIKPKLVFSFSPMLCFEIPSLWQMRCGLTLKPQA